MNNSIPYLVKNGDTLASIAKEIGITDPYDLRHFHNMNAEPKDGIGPEPPEGKTLLTPSFEKIKEINAKRAKSDEEEKIEAEEKEQKKEADEKQQKEEEKQKEEKQKETAQSAHDGKYFVVHGALCNCDKAENPKQTAKLLVTSHNKVILNAEAGKYFATEADKTFDPAVATFGKCTLKPTSSGNLPCALSPAPKWTKTFEKTKIYGKTVLTEISTLQCTVGGKIEVAKSGQTDTVMKEHSENTNPAALALINQAIEMPKLKTAYPSVASIQLKTIKGSPDFQAISSDKTKNVEKITVRPNQECSFEAKISKGNVNLTSWVIYEGFKGDKDKILYTEEQIGTQFKFTFSTEGKYRIEGYGHPKKLDTETGEYKSYEDYCLDIEVILNKLQGTELEPIDGENFSKMINGKMRLRKDFPASFKAKFLMPPTEEELENLKMYVTDASGNVLKSVKIENTVSFTPINTNAKYNFHASYKLPSGELQSQSFSGETIGNAVTGITHDAHIIRRGTPMSFAVKTGTFSFYIPEEQEAIAKEVQSVKWNLNGRLMGTGKGITIPGHEFMNLGKYVVEAYVTIANAYGTNAKDEEDDWRFEVKDNDVEAFSYIGIPKVGKTTKLEADRLIFPKLIANETVVWDTAIPHKTVDEKTISITPLKAGKEIVNCRINRQSGKTLSIDVKQAKVLGMMFTDSNGIEIEKSSWYQTVNIWVKQEHLIGEDLTIEIWDNDKMSADDYCKVINVKEYDGNLIALTLDSYIRGKAGDWANLYVKIGAPRLKLANPNNIFESNSRLDVQDKREIYSAQIGTQDGTERHYHVDYNQISYFYGKSRGIKANEKLKITIYEKGKKLFDATDVSVDTSGLIKGTFKWDSINQKLPSRVVHAVVLDSENKILYEGNKVANGGVHITKTSALLGLAEYKSAVLVKKSESIINKADKQEKCPNCDKPIIVDNSQDDLKEIFPDSTFSMRKTVADTYNKFMKELNMDNCWSKAHFFAQARVEVGTSLVIKKAESMSYAVENLPNNFTAFSVTGELHGEPNELAFKYGRIDKNNIAYLQRKYNNPTLKNQQSNEEAIANIAYADKNRAVKFKVGNVQEGDGWRFRGRGMIQLTGRGNYEAANVYTVKLAGKNIIDSDTGAKLVENEDLAVLTSMAYFNYRKNKKGIPLYKLTRGETNAKGVICPEIGANAFMANGKMNYTEKQNAFDNITSKVFKIDECKWKAGNTRIGKWHEPVDNPICTLYMQSGSGGKSGEHWGLFGNTRDGSAHQGLDLFVEPGSNVYSCIKGEVYESKIHTGYGKTVTIKVIDKEAFFNHRREYKRMYSNEGEIIQGPHFDKTQDIYLFYAHLRKVNVTKGQKVEAGEVIGTSGVSGVTTGTCAPHLHFEIFTTVYAVGMGLNYRCNPGFYVHFKGASEQSAEQKNLQKKIAEKGKINEINGKD